MTPYYEHGGVTIYHGDCLEVLPTLDATVADLMVTDPPYGVDYVNERFGLIVNDHDSSAALS
jgi:DNA modification methylase